MQKTTIILMFFLFPYVAQAHPHSWIDAEFDVSFDAEGVSSFSVNWKFDDFTASYLILDFDKNGNRRFAPPEIEALKQNAFLHLEEYHFYSYIMVGKESLPVVPENFSARMEGKSAYYSFDIPAKISWDKLDKCVFYVYDTTYYIYFTTLPGRLKSAAIMIPLV